METRQNNLFTRQPKAFESAIECGGDTEARLNKILAENREIARENLLYPTRRERFEAETMKNPLTVGKAFSYFGLLLGIFPPAAIFYKIFHHAASESFLLILLLTMNVACAVAGYFSGKIIGKIAFETEIKSWNLMLVLSPLLGAMWGIMAGAAGGVLFFVVGALFGAVFGAMVGSVALPLFTMFHRLLKRGEFVERNQFLPIAVGIVFVISVYILDL